MNYLCCYFPLLPLEIFNSTTTQPKPTCNKSDKTEQIAFAVEYSHKNRRLILQCNETAKSYGVQEDMTINTAQSLVEALQIKQRNQIAEKKTLAQMAIWANQFSPYVSCKENINQNGYALLLEISSCLKLFKGIQAFITLFNQQRQQLPYYNHTALGYTPAAAYLLAISQYHGGQSNNAPPNNAHPTKNQDTVKQHASKQYKTNTLQPHLNNVAVRYLDCEQDIIDRLQGMGITNLKKLFALPKAELGKRFGKKFVQYLQRIRGELADPQDIFQIPPVFDHEIHFIEEIEYIEGLIFPIKRLLNELGNYLKLKQLAVREIKLRIFFRNSAPITMPIGFSESCFSGSNGGHIQFTQKAIHLIRLHFATLSLPEATIAVGLYVNHFAPLQQTNQDLFSHHLLTSISKAELFDQLSARLGQGALKKISTSEEHRPELAWRYDNTNSEQTPSEKARPLWLLNQPKPLKSQQGIPYYSGELSLVQGPERIESGWWDKQIIARDYFVAHHPNGNLYWVYRNLQEGLWYLHGIFA